MFGLIVIVIAVAYLLLSIAIVKSARRHARNTGKNVKYWGWGAALVMWLIPFWDWLPTVAVHQYYCATEAGFWVYKTPEQWKLENPGVMDGLRGYGHSPSKTEGDVDNNTITYFLNERFNWVVKNHGKLLFNRWRHEYTVEDVKAGEVLARYVDFSTSQERPQAGWSGWKFWLEREYCSDGRHNKDAIFKFEDQFEGMKK